MYCYLTCTKTSQLQNSFSSSSTLADVIRQKKIVTSKKSYMRVDNCFTVLLPSFRICQVVRKDNFFDTSVIKSQLAHNTINSNSTYFVFQIWKKITLCSIHRLIISKPEYLSTQCILISAKEVGTRYQVSAFLLSRCQNVFNPCLFTNVRFTCIFVTQAMSYGKLRLLPYYFTNTNHCT